MTYSSVALVAIRTLLWFYVILAVKELLLMQTFHRLMHSDSYWFWWHRTHHTIGRSGCFQLAFRVDVVDLLIENALAPVIVLIILWLMGRGALRIPIFSLHLLALFDGGTHSINPFTVLFWNPVIDWHMNANIVHGLHHYRGNTNLGAVPLHHMWTTGARSRDESEYDRTMQTTFFDPS
jgi:sterol desaturase/sphingolipid hydroxylase (fatty acid hydroxylase superfamily)